MSNTAQILIVDDNASARLTIQALLARDGYVVHEAHSGQAALELLPTINPDVIILDVMMPEMDGFETCMKIKGDPRWETIPVIMCTALNEQCDRIEGLSAGADDFLTKPVDGMELRLRIRALVKVKAYYDLLANVLPKSIARRLREEPGFVGDTVNQGTILFSDIKGFVSFSKMRSAHEVVTVLNDVFSAFDDCTSTLGLEKIKTIGDAYMLGGALLSGDDPVDAARRVVQAGVTFFDLLDTVNAAHGISLALRVGIHTGPVVGGVIGTHRLAYDVWGDTVNVASRMESQGQVGYIQLSSDTHTLIGDAFAFENRGFIDVKGHDPIETWLLKVR